MEDCNRSFQAGLHRCRLRLLAPCRPPQPPAAPPCAVPASGSSRCRAGLMRPSTTHPRLAVRGRSCLLSRSLSPSPASHRRRHARSHTRSSPSLPPDSFPASTCCRWQPSTLQRHAANHCVASRRRHSRHPARYGRGGADLEGLSRQPPPPLAARSGQARRGFGHRRRPGQLPWLPSVGLVRRGPAAAILMAAWLCLRPLRQL